MSAIDQDSLYGWTEEDFEKDLSATLILCYETHVVKSIEASPTRLTTDHIRSLQRLGPYIPSCSRPVLTDHETRIGLFDIENDPLPRHGVFSIGHVRPNVDPKFRKIFPTGYAIAVQVQQVERLPKTWHRADGGQLYEMAIHVGTADGMDGRRAFFTVNKQGQVKSCYQRMCGPPAYGQREMVIETAHEERVTNQQFGSWALQWIADRRFCWVISAQEQSAKAHLGCMPEEVKSLLYARSLPLTVTGRKRPILHLVAAHRRRLKEGIEIDVTQFLRGQQRVTIGDTLFTVTAPTTIKPELSARSQRHYQWRSEP